MRDLLTTQSQNCYREQIQKEMLTRLTWKSRYAKLYPSCNSTRNRIMAPTQLTSDPRLVLPPVTSTPDEQGHLPPPPPPPPPLPPVLPLAEKQLGAPPIMRPVSPQTRQALYQDTSHQGNGRRRYLQRRGQMRPEERFVFPLLSSWEYGWRLGDYTLDYRTPTRAKSSVVKNTFYTKNGVFSIPSATDALG